MPANFELKARCADLAQARERARALATRWLGEDRQVDTYFETAADGRRGDAHGAGRAGRLKLRESSLSGAQLVAYLRLDAPLARRSDYVVIPVPEPERTRQLLAALLGVRRVVRKRREIGLFENVRIHLDRVEGLGDFLELEAVWDGDGAGEPEQARKVAFLRERLAIRDADLVAASYEGLLGP